MVINEPSMSNYENNSDLIDIKSITKQYVEKNLPNRSSDGYKGDYGHVLCIGGSPEMAGAITLASKAALYSGAGLVTVATAKENFSTIHTVCLELMCVDYSDFETLSSHISKADTLLIGPGLGRSDFARKLFQFVLEKVQNHQFFIIDADGLFHLSNLKTPTLPEHTVLTPHLGEWERLSGISPHEQTVQLNQKFQEKIGATIVLKKDRTGVYTSRQIYQNTTGNPGMAVGGMGDTLAGMISGLLKQYDHPTDAVLAAVYLHSYIGDQLAEVNYIVLPSRVIESIPQVMKVFQNSQ